jgi:hypothetical protein
MGRNSSATHNRHKKIRKWVPHCQGKTGHEDLQMETRKVWLLADPKVILSVTSPQAEKIKFTDGGLYSD